MQDFIIVSHRPNICFFFILDFEAFIRRYFNDLFFEIQDLPPSLVREYFSFKYSIKE